MTDKPPSKARLASRVILLDDDNRILYFQAVAPDTEHRFWVMPGGGLRKGESFADAARREAVEETGILINLGPCIWYRRHKYIWNGEPADQYEQYFVGWASSTDVNGHEIDDYMVGHHWWTLSELEASHDDFAPHQIRTLLPPILRGEYPEEPFDCGV